MYLNSKVIYIWFIKCREINKICVKTSHKSAQIQSLQFIYLLARKKAMHYILLCQIMTIQESYQLYILSSKVKSKDFATSGEVNAAISDAATRNIDTKSSRDNQTILTQKYPSFNNLNPQISFWRTVISKWQAKSWKFPNDELKSQSKIPSWPLDTGKE